MNKQQVIQALEKEVMLSSDGEYIVLNKAIDIVDKLDDSAPNLRDFFACAALQGNLSNESFNFRDNEALAEDCWDIADKMMNSRSV